MDLVGPLVQLRQLVRPFSEESFAAQKDIRQHLSHLQSLHTKCTELVKGEEEDSQVVSKLKTRGRVVEFQVLHALPSCSCCESSARNSLHILY